MAKKEVDLDKELGFEPVSDESLGFEASPEGKATLQAYLQKSTPSQGESALAGAEQGLTLNHAPQLGAAFGAGLEKAAGAMGMGPQADNAKAGIPQQSLSDLYNEYLQSNKKRDAAAAQANPWSYGAGAVGGGLLGFKGAGMVAKPAMAALAEQAPTAAATANVMNKMTGGAIPMAAAGGVSAMGANPDVPLMSEQNLADVGEGMAGGVVANEVMPPAISAIAKGAQKTASGAKSALGTVSESLIGLAPDAFKRGLKGEMLVGKEAAKKTGDEMLQFAQEVPQQLNNELNKLGAQKQAIIRIAQENGVKIDPADIDNFMQNHLGNASPSNLQEVQREMGQFHELLQTAKSGPEVQRIVRQYIGESNAEKGEFAKLFSQKQAEQKALEAGEPQPPVSQKDQFEQEFQVRKAEQQAIAGGQDPNPMEMSYEPIEGSKDVLGVIRQPQFDTDGHFTGYKKVKTQVISPDAPPIQKPKMEMLLQPTDQPGKSLGIIRQAITNEQGDVVGYKKIASKLVTDSEAAQWKDMAETVREGGKDLTEPEQLYQLYKDLKQKSQYGDYSYKTPDAQAATGQAIDDVQELLRKNIEDLEPTDAKISALKKAQEILGATDRDPRNVMKMFAGLLGKTESSTIPGASARQDLSNLVNQIKIANPDLGHQIESKAQDLANKFAVTGAVQKEIYLPRPTATLKAYAAKGANVLGYGVGKVTPEWMQTTAAALGRMGGKAQQGLSTVLKNAANKDDQTRTAIMFGLMQQPAYRDMLKEYMPQAQTDETQK